MEKDEFKNKPEELYLKGIIQKDESETVEFKKSSAPIEKGSYLPKARQISDILNLGKTSAKINVRITANSDDKSDDKNTQTKII